MGLIVIRAAGVAAAVLWASMAHAESRLALVIGQSAYRVVTPLPNPVNDARAMAQMLGDAGFVVQTASDLSQTELRSRIGDFAATVATSGPDTVSLVFYAGHGIQVDGENYLLPVDVDPKRESDIPLQAVRLTDVLNTLTAVPGKSRIILLDACRNNPFPGLDKTTGRGLAQVDVKFGAPGTLLSFSTSPGAEAEDGTAGNSPYTAALLTAGRTPDIAIEDAFKRVRLAVNKATAGRQTPWESSSLVSDFRLFTQAGASAAAPESGAARGRRSVDDWLRELRGKPVEAAHDATVSDGSEAAYEAFVGLYAAPPFGPQARAWLDLHARMAAWSEAVAVNTAAGYRGFLLKYPDSDLTATAQRLEERVRNRPVAAAASTVLPTNVALAGPSCPCGAPPAAAPARSKKAEKPEPARKRAERSPPSPRRMPVIEEDVVVVRRAPVVVYDPPPRGYGGVAVGGFRGGYGGSQAGGRGRY